MPPKGRSGRGGSATAAGGGRTSSRIAEKQEAAQHAADQQAQQEREAAEAISNLPPPESSMPPPPPPSSSKSRGRGRAVRGAENYARRATTRRGRGGNPIASYSPAPRSSPSTSAVYGVQQSVNDPFTPQRPDAADIVYGGNPDAWREAVELTPRSTDATANLMNKFVDRLASVAHDLMVHLAIEGDERDESWIHELRTHKEIFKAIYRIYTLENSVFIDIATVAARTKAESVPELWQRMTKAVAIGNLANLLSDVEDLDGDPSNVLNRLPLVQSIDEHFPAFFLPSMEKNDNLDVVDLHTMQTSCLIRTHRFIETLRGVQQAPPFRLFARVFLDMDVDIENMNDDMFGQYFMDAQLKPFPGFDINGPDAQQYRDAINQFRSMVNEMDANTLINKLEEEYSFDGFLKELKNWIRSSNIKMSGPVRRVDFADSPFAADAQLQAEARASQQERFTISGVARLQQHLATQQSQNASAPSEDSSYQAYDDDASIAGTDAEVLARSRAMAGQQAFSMSQADGTAYAQAAADTAKPTVRKRARKSINDGDSATKRVRAAEDSAMPPSSRPPMPLGPLPAGSAFDPVALSRQSQLISKANRRPAQPKQRKPWTAHDTQQLVLAVDVYKAKWSTIEKAIRENHIAFNVPERDQQGLRDKARLVKVDLLKTDAVLPSSFDLVVLGRKEKEMVIAARRNPERREGDLDADGQPINTLYDPDVAVFAPVDSTQQDHQQHNHPDQQDDAQRDHHQEFGQQIRLPPPSQAESVDESIAESAEAAGLRALQEAQMAVEAPMGNAPDAPMMAAADMGAPPSEQLGEEEPGSMVEDQNMDASSAVDPNMDVHQPLDPNIGGAGPSSEAAHV